MTEQFPWLTVIVLLPLVATLVIPFLPNKGGRTVRWFALAIGIVDLGLMCYAFWRHYDASQATLVRQVFYGDMADQMCDLVPACDLDDLDLKAQGNQEANCFGTDCVLPEEAEFKDANPREIFIATCFLGLIIAIGCYPKMATQMYAVKTMAVNAHVRAAYHQAFADELQGSVQGRWSAAIAAAQSADLWGVVK